VPYGSDAAADRGSSKRRGLRKLVSGGRVTLGAWAMIPSGLSAEVLGRGPVDWVMIDMQHGCMGYETAVEMIRAVDLGGVSSIVRVPSNDAATIGRLLDGGAAGILVPMIETVADAQRAVDACLYPPLGKRSLGPVRVGIRDGADYFASANDRTLVLPLIETRKGLEAAERIAACPGVGGLFVGPYDLSLSLGLPPAENDGNPTFDAAIARIVAAAQAAGIPAATFASAETASLRLKQGFRMISIVTDFYSIAAKMAADATTVREQCKALQLEC